MKNLTSPSYIKEYMEKSDFFFKKKLGQNFLKDENIARAITDSLDISKDECVLEVGPGFGSLTQFLVRDAYRVKAVEIDPFAVKVLNEVFEDCENLDIILADVLKADLAEILKDAIDENRNIKAISNLPYYITSSVILKLLRFTPHFENIVVMIQKEVSERLNAPAGSKNYSSYTVLINYYADTEKLFDVSHNVFVPAPKVDSSVMRIVPLKEPRVKVASEEIFFRTVKAGFAMRRKTLLNNISAAFEMDKEKAGECITAAGLKPEIRAEKLTIEEFAALSDSVHLFLQ